MISDLRVCGSDGLELRISLARALSDGLPLGVIASLTESPGLTRTRFVNMALGRGRPVFETWASAQICVHHVPAIGRNAWKPV
ncbi:hypothetical protein BG617_10155 [Lactiplantibacillus paraplantarum]|nr:hypothetical protein BG617_10155 [Lactiplantibacillus paraplantarum]